MFTKHGHLIDIVIDILGVSQPFLPGKVAIITGSIAGVLWLGCAYQRAIIARRIRLQQVDSIPFEKEHSREPEA